MGAMALEHKTNNSLQHALIRVSDLVLASLLLLLLSPLLLTVMLLIHWRIGSPIFFRQLRAGKGNQPFYIIKFRSMLNTEGADGQPLPDEERLTPLGRFLRKSSIDELPELINVLRGEMSLVGPRPLFLKYLPYYKPRERSRLDVLPGITGLAQVSGRNYISWDKKLELDAKYVERLSLGLYFKILILTPLTMLDWHKVAVNPYTAEIPLDIARADIVNQYTESNHKP